MRMKKPAVIVARMKATNQNNLQTRKMFMDLAMGMSGKYVVLSG
jgi:hypothetical protein